MRVAVVTDIVCPFCKAPVGEACKTTTGNLVPFNHYSRRVALRRAKR